MPESKTATAPAPTVHIRKPYDPAPRIHQTHNTEPSLAKQSFAAECDINRIMAKAQKTGIITHFNNHQGDYTDLPDATDYHEAMNAILAANERFADLPSSVRSRFHNDPANLLEFVANPDNLEEAVSLGLAAPREQLPDGEGVAGGSPATPKTDPEPLGPLDAG